MTSADLHQVVFNWPHTEPTTVIVTGTFDKWASSIHLVKVPAGFEGVTDIPWGQKIKYKFIVDGEWVVLEDQPTEVDPGGFVNNIYTAPAKPVTLPSLETTSFPLGAEKPMAAEAHNHTTNGDSVVAEVVDQPEYIPQPLPKHAQLLTGTDASADGIDIPKITIPTSECNDPDMGTKSSTIMEKSAPQEPSSPVAPLLPIMIVPVNAAENNTVGSLSPSESMHVLPRFASNSNSPVVNTSHIPDSVVEESTQRTTELTLAPEFNTIPTSESVIPESASAVAEVIHVDSEAPENFHNGSPVLSETTTTPANVEAEPVSTSVTLTVAEVSASNILVEQSTADPEPDVAAVFPSTDLNLVTEEKAQTPSSVPDVRDDQKTAVKPSAITPEIHAGNAAVVSEKRKVAQPTATPTIPTSFRKKASTTSSVKDTQEFGSNSPTTDNSPTSSRFNSIRKKRTSFFGKIKNIFHDKEKEMK
jgi:hypothetical protein